MTGTPLRARSNLEAHLYMDLRPCGCGEARFDRASSVIELPGGELASRYAGSCARCGTPREFVFALPPQPMPVPDPAGDLRYGGDDPSALLDAGEWLWAADAYARAVPPDPHRLAGPDRRRARARLASAAAALDEALKCIPPGHDRVPAADVRSPLGAVLYQREPGRFRRARMAAVRDSYRAALRLFG